MSAFEEQRRKLRDALKGAGVLAFSTKPDRFTPPAAFVGPGDPYITRDGATFGGERVNHSVVLVVRSGVNETRTDELDELIVTALDVLHDLDDFDTGDVNQPGQITVNGQNHLAVAIDVSSQIHRNL